MPIRISGSEGLIVIKRCKARLTPGSPHALFLIDDSEHGSPRIRQSPSLVNAGTGLPMAELSLSPSLFRVSRPFSWDCVRQAIAIKFQ